MRMRVRGPSGVATLTLDDSATVQELQSVISEKTSLPAFELKSGYPPKALDLAQFDGTVKLKDTGLKLDGEQLIAVARDQSATSDLLNLTRKPNPFDPATGNDPPEVPVPTHAGVMILRVMPDDNSCLFRALGTALMGDGLDIMHELRAMVAQGIQTNPELYNAAVLQKAPDAYCEWIQREDSWGGGIEIGLISQAFGVEVASINVQDLRVDKFNEAPLGSGEKRQRVILVYSGIHYDTIALSPDGCMVPELDIKQFDSEDDIILEKARELCAKLQASHYYTDTAGFDLKCNICGWMGKGEKGATEHAKQTGHMNFGEATG
ncbi:OTU-like cysteine protease [Rhizodiscina lignyota]|uniref:Ubiquitin thioesterase OTU n=1 Tax=Rhizodiscina lignyota TaxID=1504668 RepID=A0A9P4ID54_9PEZI|nr:OTU-like cysteine protease [Rhizodiscina lignyota]